jgi:hypothetical protein
MVGTPMPEAATDFHHDPHTPKDDVELPPKFGKQAAVQAITKAESVEFPPESHFRCSVAARLTHHARARCG